MRHEAARPGRLSPGVVVPGLRVVVVAGAVGPAAGGDDGVLRLVDHLAVRGHVPVVLARAGRSYESCCGAWVEVVPVPAPGRRGLLPVRADLTGLLHELAPDVVHLSTPAGPTLAAARAARALGVPAVAVVRAVPDRRWGRAGRELRALSAAVDLTLVPGPEAAALVLRRRGGPVALWSVAGRPWSRAGDELIGHLQRLVAAAD